MMDPTSLKLMGDFRNTYLPGDSRRSVLEVGSRNERGSFRPIFEGWDYTGLDIVFGPNVDLRVHDPYRWTELADDSFDAVISGHTFEHIEFVWLTMAEIKRVMRPGGYCCIIAPARGIRHRFPIDCWRIQERGMIALGKWAELRTVTTVKADDRWATVMYVGRK